jgi:hypothetical protein
MRKGGVPSGGYKGPSETGLVDDLTMEPLWIICLGLASEVGFAGQNGKRQQPAVSKH